jgi:hypothetical protein
MVEKAWCEEVRRARSGAILVKLALPFKLTGEGFILYVRNLQPCA